MHRLRSISSLTVLVLVAGLATAQERGPHFAAVPHFIIFGQKRQSPPQHPPQRQERDERNPGQQNSGGQPNIDQRQGDRRFIYQGPGPHAGDWFRKHADDPPEQQLKELQSDPRFKNLPPDRQQQFVNRLNRLNSMPPQRRQQVLNELDVIEHMTPQQQQRARAMFGDMRQLPEDRRRAVASALTNLRDMSPEDRQRMIDSDDYKRSYSDKEREILRGMTDLGLYPGGPRD